MTLLSPLFSAQACPFIAGDREFSLALVPPSSGVAICEIAVAAATRPKNMWLMKTRKSRMETVQGGSLLETARWDAVRQMYDIKPERSVRAVDSIGGERPET